MKEYNDTSTILKTAKLSLNISRGMMALIQQVPTVIKKIVMKNTGTRQ